ncbi:MAG: GYF domain-containing protein [Bdellovibrionales bacterium]|nr:GYF domain-containing protein [Bdellovibrionales bacterium]
MQQKWYLLKNEDQIFGPFSTEEIIAYHQQKQSPEQEYIWGNPQQEWKTLQWWKSELPRLINQSEKNKPTKQWHYAFNGQAQGPFTREELIQTLKDVQISAELLIWTKGMKAWAPIFEFSDLLNEIGINKRQFPRADIEGSVQIQIGSNNRKGRLLTISEGGFGADQLNGLTVGQILNIKIESEDLHEIIHSKSEVRYVTEKGYAGFRFQHINMEAKSVIIQYMKQSHRVMLKVAA